MAEPAVLVFGSDAVSQDQVKARSAAEPHPVSSLGKRNFDVWLERQLHALYELEAEPRSA